MTCEEIVIAAYGYSKKNQPQRIANEAEELRLLVWRVFQAVFQVAARVNWTYFGKDSGAIAQTTGFWVIPTDLELLGRLELAATGTEVIPVGISERDPEPGDPTAYRLGPNLYPAENVTGTPTLRFLYSRTPVEPVDFDTTDVEAPFPAAHLPLVILETALYMAVKDGRTDEFAWLTTMRDASANAYVQHLQHAAIGIPRTWFPQRFQGEELVPLLRVQSTGEE